MYKYFVVAVVAATILSKPAFAGEGGEARIEARGGLYWSGGDSPNFLGGIAAGYDLDLGDTVFLGPEVSYDTNFEGDHLVNLGVRLGFKAGKMARIYVNAAYDVADGDEFNAGGGAQFDFSNRVYGKVEYRRYLFNGPDVNIATVGLGLKF
jgi:outer membrane immunogenic protein